MRRNGSLSGAEGLKRTESTGQKAHKAIPTGYKASEAANKMKNSELEALQKQAYSQASRFEVLRGEDVEALSRVCNSSLFAVSPYFFFFFHLIQKEKRRETTCQILALLTAWP